MTARRLRFDVRQAGKQILLVLVLLLVANVAFLTIFVRPRIRSFRSLREDSQPRLLAVQKRQKEVEGQEKFLATLEKSRKDLERFRSDVLSTRQKNMIEVQYELARLARQFNINMERVQYENEALEDESLERMAMVVPLAGGYSNLRKFVQAVEQSQKFLVLERVALETGQEGGVLLQLNITLATYFDSPEMRQAAESMRRPGRKA
jgi:Tfp pilus assembly protein PilO